MIVRQLPGATADLDEALDFYARISPSLVEALLDEVIAAQRRIAGFPQAWHPLGAKGLRRFVLGRFPYAIIFRAKPDEILIVAYAHTRRLPGYWRSRLKGRR